MKKCVIYFISLSMFFTSYLCAMDAHVASTPNKLSMSPRRKNSSVQGFNPEVCAKGVKKQLFGDIPSVGVQLEQKESKGATFFVSNTDNIPEKMKAAYQDHGLKNYVSQAFVFSQKGIINAMNDATARGAVVDLSVGVHCQNKMDQYKISKISRDKDLHGKNIAGLEASPSKGESKKSIFITGSANPSDAIWPTGNLEAVVVVKDDVELTKKAYQLMRSNSFTEQKDIVHTSPDRREVYSSRKTDLNKSRAQRVLTVAKKTGDDRIVWASTMNINDKDMANAMSKAAKSGADTRLVVNKTALTKNGIPLLQKMADDGVKVSVFYPADDARIIQHKKELIRNDLYVISNANFTNEGDSQKNLETYFPHDTHLISEAKKDFERVQAKCVPFEKALELLKVTNIKKAEKKKTADEKKKEEKSVKKRKLSDDAEAPKTKRQKLGK